MCSVSILCIAAYSGCGAKVVGLVVVEREGFAVGFEESSSGGELQQLMKKLGTRSDMLLGRENSIKCPDPASHFYQITILFFVCATCVYSP